ncbi:MAG: TonB-dependent receptor plug domain-containing protein, partial [Ignavibacteriales bacterium]|nr:TonB-dependent receptor plug domain-containing protein [Ignavibacteriales bacterium]
MKKSFFLLMFMLIAAGALWSQVQKDTIRYQLQPVTITATRVSEGWLEVPLAINVLEHNDIQHTKGYGLDEILSGVPGVLAQSRYGNQDIRLTIRGFGARGAGAKSNAGTSRGIRVLIDGFPETEPDGRTSFDLIDLSGAGSVEVVRSNASSVWGNASGGVVNILSNTTFTAPYSHLQSMFGSFGFHKEMLHGGAMLGQGRFFFSASNTTYDGWRDHSASSQILVNTGVISPLAEKTSLGVYLTGTSNLFRIPGPLSQGQFDSNPQQAQNLKDSVTGVNYTLVARDERRRRFHRTGRSAAGRVRGAGRGRSGRPGRAGR